MYIKHKHDIKPTYFINEYDVIKLESVVKYGDNL